MSDLTSEQWKMIFGRFYDGDKQNLNKCENIKRCEQIQTMCLKCQKHVILAPGSG